MRLRLRTLSVAIVILMWIAGTGVYWWQLVPSVPRHVIPLEGRSTRWSSGVHDALVLTGKLTYGIGHQQRQETVGPVEVYDLVSGAPVLKALNPDVVIRNLILRPRPLAIIHRGEWLEAVDLKSGKTLATLVEIDPAAQTYFIDGGRLVLCHSGRVATAFDLETGKELWSRDSVARIQNVPPSGTDVIGVSRLEPAPMELWSARTGRELNSRGQSRWPVSVSDDGTRALFTTAGGFEVDDLRSAQPVLEVQEEGFRMRTLSARLSPDAIVVWAVQSRIDNTRLANVVAWDCATGRESRLMTFDRSQPLTFSPACRYALAVKNVELLRDSLVRLLPRSWQARLQRSTMFWNVMMKTNGPPQRRVDVTDVRTGKLLGSYVTESGGDALWVVDDARGSLAIADRSNAYIFRIPADRNWIWLIQWMAGPLLAGQALGWLFRKWRRRVSPIGNGAA